MEIFVSPMPPAAAIVPRSPSYVSVKKWNFAPRSKLNDENDPLLQAAIERASLRFQETSRRDPLFIDPYAGCLVPSNIEVNMKPRVPLYCLATKFIDDKVLNALKGDDELRQVVLFTDGMDTRPYRLHWPRSTVIFDISPERVFRAATLKLEGMYWLVKFSFVFKEINVFICKDVGAKIGRSCLFLHIPSEYSDIEETMRNKGFDGTRPSLWVFQGLPVVNLARFKEILSVVSNLAIKGCLLFGELPSWLSETAVGIKPTKERWTDNLFMSSGFRVDIVAYDDVAREFGKELEEADDKNILFIAEQLRFSDDQMERWRREFQRIEEEVDEEGFEEL